VSRGPRHPAGIVQLLATLSGAKRAVQLSTTAVAFLLVFAAVTALSFARHSIYGLILYAFVLYAHPHTQWWGAGLPDLRWSLLAAVLAFAATFVHPPNKNSLPLFTRPIVIAILIFVGWVVLQTAWALNVDRHLVLVNILPKYVLLLVLMYRCIDTPDRLRMFLWAHVLGATYMGWDAVSSYQGGRFEGFGGPDLNEANAGALQIITALFCAAGLFLAGNWRERIAVAILAPIMVNGIVLTQSRSGFIAAAFAGVIFNYFSPSRYRWRVLGLSVLAIVGFAALANESFWERMGTIQHKGERIEGVDTGGGRLEAIQAQLRMFRDYPLGCGHRCTAELSPIYMEDWMLTGVGDERGRSSHNTAMTLLVEQGVPGIIFYGLFLAWLAIALTRLHGQLGRLRDPLPSYLPGIAAALAAVTVGDMFVDYLKLEVRFWLVGLILVVVNLHWLETKKEDALATAVKQQRGEFEADPRPNPTESPSATPPQEPAARPAPAVGAVVQRAPIRSRYKNNSTGGS
jgi:O-Antigen ligase